jgi:hypothetical protein
MFNDPAFARRNEKSHGRPEDNVCPSRDSNRSSPQYKPGVLLVTTLLEKLVFAQLVKNIPRIFWNVKVHWGVHLEPVSGLYCGLDECIARHCIKIRGANPHFQL